MNNEKHFSNTQESLIYENITPYVEKEYEMLDLSEEQQTLLIIDVFLGQMSDPVIKKSKENNIKLTRVPRNTTNLFQLLDLTINGSAKAFLKKKFTKWYSSSISKQLEEGKSIEDIDVEWKVSILKPLHAKWINELYYYMNFEESHNIVSNGWKAAFITEAIEQETRDPEPFDTFFDINR